ncbi:hypothetical protein KAT92_01275 [Candidatus Babeliales bacterium]|nr:hypothetical protein [Candidatus Babeliales bacterium]
MLRTWVRLPSPPFFLLLFSFFLIPDVLCRNHHNFDIENKDHVKIFKTMKKALNAVGKRKRLHGVVIGTGSALFLDLLIAKLMHKKKSPLLGLLKKKPTRKNKLFFVTCIILSAVYGSYISKKDETIRWKNLGIQAGEVSLFLAALYTVWTLGKEYASDTNRQNFFADLSTNLKNAGLLVGLDAVALLSAYFSTRLLKSF